ncbi:nucleotide exchange factor GrpE [Corynebacterium glucuronolyticum]|uniref:nucleotide exchange factor GrpE n=1 Tax=Corynebacterium glucuronolyticum TaxID=39791 RepID=UPI00191F812B|nr:nucleotide exchange factor GrpE [Corynebacterium glucuronolyticum]QQU88560.1 nucleotide exchange factor GrpE [Corynebacterium glucuronolyticum]
MNEKSASGDMSDVHPDQTHCGAENDADGQSDASVGEQGEQASQTISIDSPTNSGVSGIGYDKIIERLNVVDKGIKQFHERATKLEEINFRMNESVVSLRRQSDRSLLKPAFTQLASLAAEARQFGLTAAETDQNAFNSFADSIEDIFSLYDLFSVGAAVGDKFDASKHTAIQRKDTDDEELDATIARVTRQGYSYSGDSRTFIPAQVAVWRYQPTDTADS